LGDVFYYIFVDMMGAVNYIIDGIYYNLCTLIILINGSEERHHYLMCIPVRREGADLSIVPLRGGG